ncbi:hypothetical protein Goarm_021141 [Gossypium armourianum]|uniref:Uncharacterized protein n=1 Tax=Gossypium armourianum TaxID=34283 RepID=A0A7J9IQP3_9ROSI|nr:hypothetical protein [Gossypium armourianum]
MIILAATDSLDYPPSAIAAAVALWITNHSVDEQNLGHLHNGVNQVINTVRPNSNICMYVLRETISRENFKILSVRQPASPPIIEGIVLNEGFVSYTLLRAGVPQEAARWGWFTLQGTIQLVVDLQDFVNQNHWAVTYGTLALNRINDNFLYNGMQGMVKKIYKVIEGKRSSLKLMPQSPTCVLEAALLCKEIAKYC